MTTPSNRPVICPILIGRTADLAALHLLIDQAKSGSGQVALLSGEAGVGKSRLVTETKTYAASQGFLLLQGNCFQSDSAFPYAPFLDLLRSCFSGSSTLTSHDDLTLFARELSRFLPDVTPLLSERTPLIVSSSTDPQQEKRRLFALLLHFFAEQATYQPLLFIVEDLHWSDETSLELLLYMARGCRDLPILFVLTYRNDEVSPELRHCLAQFDREQLAYDFSLKRLTRAEVDEMLQTIFATHQAVHTGLLGGGSTWGDVDHATHAFSLAVPCGIISTTGVGGLTLGGGLGYLTRKCGLAIDNLIAADVVLADGRLVTADKRHYEDLFWGLRGGGGNFGVVTSFVFQAHPIHTVYAGPMLWELDQAPEVMRWYQQVIKQAPDDLYGFFAFLTVPPGPPFPEHLHNKKMCGVVWCYTGPMELAEETFKPIRGNLTPALDFVGPIPHPALQSMFDALYPPGLQWYWKADFVNELSDEAIQLHVKHASQIPTMHSTMHLYPVNGAAHRVGKNDTAWSYRETTWAEVIVGVDPDPANKDRIVDWARKYWDDLHPYSAGGAYVNFMMEEGEERVKASYRDNYERLVAIKGKYDPTNFFRVNQNIKSAI